MGRSRTYDLAAHSDGSQSRAFTDAAGLTTTTERTRSHDATSVSPDGVVTRSFMATDPRFGAASLYPTRIETVMPSGLTRVEELQRSVSLSDPADPLAMTGWTEQRLVNGKLWTTSYDVATRSQTMTSPSGLSTSQTFSLLGDLVGMEAPGAVPWAFGYDAEGKLTSTAQTDGSATLTDRMASCAHPAVAGLTLRGCALPGPGRCRGC